MGTTMAEISTAINQINIKKQNLKESLLHLQSQSQSKFNLNWSDFDSYFTSLQSSLQSKFNLLQTLNPIPDPNILPTRRELISFCQNSDGFGLKQFIAHAPDRISILDELPEAYRFAPDPAGMVLEAMDGFYSSGCKGPELQLFRSSCLIMLEGLMRVKPDVRIGLKYKAMEMAVEWNRYRVLSLGDKGKEENAFGFLLLVGAYGLIDGFSMDEVIDCFVDIANKRQVIDLCRQIVPDKNINDLIQKLINKDMHITAVKFSIELEKTDVFPPVGLLEEQKLKSISVIEEAAAENNEVIIKEISTLKAIIRCIDGHHLQSQYPKDSVVELVNKLENEMGNITEALVNDLRFKKTLPRDTSAAATSLHNVVRIQNTKSEAKSQASALSSDHVSQYHDSPVRTGSAAPYRLTGRNIGYSNNPLHADAGPIFFVPWSHPPSNDHSNGWISE